MTGNDVTVPEWLAYVPARICDGGRWIAGHHQLPQRYAKSCDPAISSTRDRRPASFSRAAGATREARFFLIAAFCRLAKSLSHSEPIGWLVGAVGIETASLTSKSRQRKALPTAPHPKC